MAEDTTTAKHAAEKTPEAPAAAFAAPLAEGEEPAAQVVRQEPVVLMRAEEDLFFGTGTRALSKGQTFSKSMLAANRGWEEFSVELDQDGRPVKDSKKK